MQAYERLIRYARIYTTSDENAEITPSTARQFDLSIMLAEEMTAMGFQEVTVDEHAYTMGQSFHRMDQWNSMTPSEDNKATTPVNSTRMPIKRFLLFMTS